MAATGPTYRDAAAPIDARVRDLLSRMTLEEKAAQLLSLGFTKGKILDAQGNFAPDKAQAALANGIGQIARPSERNGTKHRDAGASITGTVNFVNAVQRHLVEHTRLGIPALFHEEALHGLMDEGATVFPSATGLASTWDPALVEQIYTVAAREGRLRGSTVALAPVLDLARDPRWGRVEEFFSEDPVLVSAMAIAAVRGLQGRTRPIAPDRMFATLKHFVHANPEGGLNLAPAVVGERTLREAYLVPFVNTIKAADPAILMPSYNELDGVPMHANRAMLETVGRQRLGFRGAYFSDYNGITNLISQHHMAADDAGAAVLAINAGVDAELADSKAYIHLPELVRAGRVKEARVDEAVAQILRLKFEAGLFEHPYTDLPLALRQTNTQADVRLARTAAEKAIVLLKNDGLLPLRAGLRLAVIGPNAAQPQFGGYSGDNAKAVSVLDGLKALSDLTVDYAEGVRLAEVEPSPLPRRMTPLHPVDPTSNDRRIAEAVEVARRSDTVLLVLGDAPETTREAIFANAPGDRDTLNLFGDQDRLVEAILATGKPVVALLLNGRALAVTRLAHGANALLEGWYLGQEGGHAVADVLFGRVNPGGKLPVSFPRSGGAVPVYYNHHPSSEVHRYIEDERTALFPFGHGLSFTTFDIAAPRLSRISIRASQNVAVEVDVTNTGTRTGEEVVQLYIRDDISSVPRPVLELRHFQRVSLKPGEKKTLRFDLTPDDLAFWDIDMAWTVEAGTFTVFAGSSSEQLVSATLLVVA